MGIDDKSSALSCGTNTESETIHHSRIYAWEWQCLIFDSEAELYLIVSCWDQIWLDYFKDKSGLLQPFVGYLAIIPISFLKHYCKLLSPGDMAESPKNSQMGRVGRVC